jgi:hypothetical protein
MRKGAVIILAAVVPVVIVIAAAVWFGLGYVLARGAGPVVSEEHEVGTFTQIHVAGEGTLVVTQGGTPELRIEAQRKILDRLEAEVIGDTLRIRERWGWFGFGTIWGNEPITYHVTVPDLQALAVSGSIAVENEGVLEAEEFTLDASGSTAVDLELDTGSLAVDISGSSDLTFRGRADIASYETSGSTKIAARGLISRTVTVDSSGSSNIEVNAEERLTVEASGSSSIAYVGDPTVEQDISGSGEVRRLEE